jgi:hypothetical protein
MITPQSEPPSTPLTMSGDYQEGYEQLLALTDKVGAAYADAYQQISAAYFGAYPPVGLGGWNLQDMIASPERWEWPAMFPSTASSSGQPDTATDRAAAIGDKLSEMCRKIGLAYVDAGEKASLAAAGAHEEIAAANPVPLVKTAAAAHAELVRKLTEASVTTIRQLIV